MSCAEIFGGGYVLVVVICSCVEEFLEIDPFFVVDFLVPLFVTWSFE